MPRHPWRSGNAPAPDTQGPGFECQFFQLFRCFLSSVLPLRSVGRSNFDKGRHNSNNYVDSKSTYNYNELLYYIMKINSGQSKLFKIH